MRTLMQWYRHITGEDTINAVAAKAGIVGSTLSRQVKAGTLTPENVVAIARAYDADVIDALIISGLISREDATRSQVEAILADITDRDLADEVWSRMQEGRVVEPGHHPNLVVIEQLDTVEDAALKAGDADAEMEAQQETP